MRVSVTEGALDDIDEALAYLEQSSPSAVVRLQARIEELLAYASRFPQSGPETDEPGVRRLNTTPFRYFLLYEIVDDGVLILALRHGARDPDLPTRRFPT